MKSDLGVFKQFTKKSNKFTLEGKSQAVIYTRVSTKEQAENNASLSTQKKYCEMYAKKRNLNIVEYFGGTYESAKSDERKEFQKMINYVKRHKGVAYIIVYSFDRFSRTGVNGSYITEQLKKQGVIVLSATQEVDSTTSAGSFQQDLFFLFSKFDNELRRDKTVSGMQEKLRKGYICGSVPFGYTNMNPGKGKLPQLEINKEGKLLKKAFELKAKHDLSYAEITERLKPYGWNKGPKKLSDYFKNPFYCGIIVNKIIPGEAIEGIHPPIVSREVFLKVNKLLEKTSHGGKHSKDDENLPLKRFVLSDSCETPLTGYLVRKKGLYYYKNNRIGSKENISAKKMHERFSMLLEDYQLTDTSLLKPMKQILIEGFVELHKESLNTAIELEKKVSEIEGNIDTIEKRFALGKIDESIYNKFHSEFTQELASIQREIEKTRFNLSNLEKSIEDALNYAVNLPKMWVKGNLEEKRRIQKLVFPKGIRYNFQNHDYRTFDVNPLFVCIPQLTKELPKKKKGTKAYDELLSRLVPRVGIEPTLRCQNWILNPARLPIPPPGHKMHGKDSIISLIVEYRLCFF